MDTQQNATQSNPIPDVTTKNVATEKPLTEAQERYISFKAVDGKMPTVGNPFASMTHTEFAAAVGVDRTTLWRWESSIPEFWAKVKERRSVIFSRDRVAKVWSRVYVDAIAGKEPQQRLFLGQYDDWKPPAQAHDVKIGGWADAINAARKRKDDPDVIDADQ